MTSKHIQEYSFGKIIIDGVMYTDDVILLGEDVKSGWWRKEGHRLHTEDLQDVIGYGPELLIIGTGNSGRMTVPSDVESRLDFEVGSYLTEKACEKYNLAIRKNTRVAGALHLTC